MHTFLFKLINIYILFVNIFIFPTVLFWSFGFMDVVILYNNVYIDLWSFKFKVSFWNVIDFEEKFRQNSCLYKILKQALPLKLSKLNPPLLPRYWYFYPFLFICWKFKFEGGLKSFLNHWLFNIYRIVKSLKNIFIGKLLLSC